MPSGARLLLIPCPLRCARPLSVSSSLSPPKARPGLPSPRPGEPPRPPIRRRIVAAPPDWHGSDRFIGVSAGIRHEGGQIQGRRQGRCQVRITTPLPCFFDRLRADLFRGHRNSSISTRCDVLLTFFFSVLLVASFRLAVKSKGAEKPAKGRKGKAGKDPNKPKRAPSAFFVFM